MAWPLDSMRVGRHAARAREREPTRDDGRRRAAECQVIASLNTFVRQRNNRRVWFRTRFRWSAPRYSTAPPHGDLSCLCHSHCV